MSTSPKNKQKFVLIFARAKIEGYSRYIIADKKILRLPYETNGRYNDWSEVKSHTKKNRIGEYWNLVDDYGKTKQLKRNQIQAKLYKHEQEYQSNIIIESECPF